MRVIKGIQNVTAFRRPSCLTIGTFDGVHRGHQAVIKRAVETAARTGARSVVMTFDPHPRSRLGKGGSPPLLTCTAHKLALLRELGVGVCLLVELDEKLAAMPPSDFVMEIVHKKLNTSGLVVGPRLRFGKGRKGTPALLKRLGKKLGFQVDVVDEVFLDSLAVSSTAVRLSVQGGFLPMADTLLGRRFSIFGRVVGGRAVGRDLGYRTANIKPLDEVIPPLGVYIVEVVVDGQKHLGALNIGWIPTFRPRELLSPVLEVHILDFDRPIYRKRVELIFHDYVRDERLFASPAELTRQIALDIEEVKRYFDERITNDSSVKRLE